MKTLIKYIYFMHLTCRCCPAEMGGFALLLKCWKSGLSVQLESAAFFFFPLAIDSITMIYRDTLKVNYVVNACPSGRQRITGKKCKKFEIPNSKG